MDGVYTIDIDLESGEAFISLIGVDNNVQIARIGNDCLNVIDGCFTPIQGIPNFAFINQNRFGILPFSIDISQVSESMNRQIEFSINGNGVSFNKDSFFVEKTEIEGEQESPEQEIEIDNSRQEIQIWGGENLGVRSVKFGSLPGLAHEVYLDPEETIRLPRFSWSSSGIKTDFILFVGRENGQIDKYIFDSPELNAKAGNELVINKSIPININPLRGNKINGISINETSPFVFFSSRRGVIMVNAETMQIVSFIKTPADFKISFQKSKDSLWGTSEGYGSIIMIKPEEMDSNSSQSSESTEFKTTSSSVSSISSSFSSESTEIENTSSKFELSSSSTSSELTSSSLKNISGTHWTVGVDTYLYQYSAPQPTAYDSTNGYRFVAYTVSSLSGTSGGIGYRQISISNLKIYADIARTHLVGSYPGTITVTVLSGETKYTNVNCGTGMYATFKFEYLFAGGGGPRIAQVWWN